MRNHGSPRHRHGILYNILTSEEINSSDALGCNCECLVRVKLPENTCRAAFGVLTKAIHFMKSSPAFKILSARDQLLLLQDRWGSLFILGLAQEHISVDVQEFHGVSILKTILMNGRQEPSAALVQIHKLQMFLKKVWTLGLGLREYTWLRNAVLFCPGHLGPLVTIMNCGEISEVLLESEAQRRSQESQRSKSSFGKTFRCSFFLLISIIKCFWRSGPLPALSRQMQKD
ncbi:hypothetical protein DNTS_026329 [Danionella cerebrum]|uniref:NR LBD domain-containing protein n=1 Tax=Danionella cerebrum TaxID=2873325 RepID=A0A553QLI4_9TELE|nr:hypothetical protein DNTS_026329 [Danionella translucida]